MDRMVSGWSSRQRRDRIKLPKPLPVQESVEMDMSPGTQHALEQGGLGWLLFQRDTDQGQWVCGGEKGRGSDRGRDTSPEAK